MRNTVTSDKIGDSVLYTMVGVCEGSVGWAWRAQRALGKYVWVRERALGKYVWGATWRAQRALGKYVGVALASSASFRIVILKC